MDAYGDEGHVSFLCAFEDEVNYPIDAAPWVIARGAGTKAGEQWLDLVEHSGPATSSH